MVIVLFLSCCVHQSPHYMEKRRKNVWIDQGDFPTLSRDRKEHHCEQLPIPIALTPLFDSQYCYKRTGCLSKTLSGRKTASSEQNLTISPKVWNDGYWTNVTFSVWFTSWCCFDWQVKWFIGTVLFLWLTFRVSKISKILSKIFLCVL